MNNNKYVNLSTLAKNNVDILLNEKEEIMKAYQEGMPIMTYIPKQHNPNTPPKYFRDFQKKVENFIDVQKEINIQLLEFIKEQRKVNVQNEKNWKEQRKFNKLIINRLDKVEHRLDKVEHRLDNLIKKNNLKE